MPGEDYLTARGWLTTPERNALFKYAAACPLDGTIVNVGVEYGSSVVCLRAGNETASIYAIDIDLSPNECDPGIAVFIEEDSYIVVEEWPKRVEEKDYFPDLVFLDGDHYGEGPKRDIAWLSMVKVGGVVIFHDCYDFLTVPEKIVHGVCPEVNAAVEEWYDHNYYDWEELPHVDTMRIFRRVI